MMSKSSNYPVIYSPVVSMFRWILYLGLPAFLASGWLVAAETRVFDEDRCSVTIPEGWEWDPQETQGAFRCTAFDRVAGRAITFQILEGEGAVDDAFAKDMDDQFSGLFKEKMGSRFLESANGRGYQHTFLGKRGDACAIRYHVAHGRLYAISFVSSVPDLQDQKLVDEIMAFLTIDAAKPIPSQTEELPSSTYDVFMPFSSGSIVVLFWWVCLLVSILTWVKRLITFETRRLHPGVSLYGALRNQLILLSLLTMSGIIVSFTRMAGGGGSLNADTFIRDVATFFGTGLAVLGVLLAITVRRVGLPKLNAITVAFLIGVPADVVLVLVLLHKVLYL